MSKFEVNKYNIDLMKRIDKYQKEILKEGEFQKPITGTKREPKRLSGGSKYVLPSGEVDKMDDQVLTVNVSRDELKAGKRVNRLKKGTAWRDFSNETADMGLDLVDKGLSIKQKYDPTAQAMNSAKHMLGGKKKHVNRLKKGTAWRDFSYDTADMGLDLVDKGLSIKQKYDPAAQAQASISKALGGSRISKKRMETAINKLEAYMSGTSKLKPTKLQMEVLKSAGVLDDAVDMKKSAKKAVKRATGGGMPKQPSPWIVHVQNYAKQHNIPYKEAMSKAKATYKR
jgi:hypothetical protein